ncbi:hypothetical protein BPAE_0325g00020 [Botrytis paeoniae]|uniref:Uncharacterized protein n=1 Tax=Botrytis paeoniae TaxID=278948 RepID=A0A4Z1F667_9HELO|nr:hypothetical protein BPAE_0325g00020 [Botrytis paeoniae]
MAAKKWPTSGATTVENMEELVVYMSFEVVDTSTDPLKSQILDDGSGGTVVVLQEEILLNA